MIRLSYLFGIALMTSLLAGISECDGLRAAEIRLKPQAAPNGAMVTLGDLADVFATDSAESERLRGIELFPSPPQGRERFIRARELHDLLLLRGVSLAEHRFSGASQIAVAGFGEAAVASPSAAASVAHTRRATSRVADALKAHLMARVSAETPWQVDVTLPDEIVRLLADPATELQVGGGEAPWVGAQRFELSLTSPEGPRQVVVDAHVSIPASLVIAARSLSRGVMLRASDLQLCHAEVPQDQPNAIYSVDQAIGKETTRSIPAGKLVTTDAIQSPLYVRRGEIVTVYAHAAGIRIRTQGRARDDGGNGTLVAVESLETREAFFARVCGVREVEVFARAARVAHAEPPATR